MLIRGQVVHSHTNEGIGDVRVALHLGETELCGDFAAKDGRFQVKFDQHVLETSAGRDADLYFRIFSPDGELLKSITAEGLINRKGADAEIILDLAPEPQAESDSPPPSEPEYEALRRAIIPFVDEHSLPSLSATEIGELRERTGVPRDRLEQFAASERLARETRLPPELFFGLSRQGLPINLDELLKENPRHLREALDRAVAGSQIPSVEAAAPLALSQLVTMATERIPVSELISRSGLQASGELRSLLKEQGVTTLAQLRKAATLDLPEDLSDTDQKIVAQLQAQSRLLTLHPEPALTSELIRTGFSSIASIARAAPDEIADATGLAVDAPVIKDLIAGARTQHALMQTVSLGLLGSQASGLSTVEEWRADHPIRNVISEKCSCRDCEAAVSPLAYLADLMQYAIDHLRNAGQPVDLIFFENNFYQPFGKLPADCSGMEEEVRQARICVEVLRAYLGGRPLANSARESALKEAERRYVLDVYQIILNKLGTDLTEMRLARGASAEERQRIAERIGISEAALPGMYFDPTANAGSLTESALEREFGLRDTTQPPIRNIPPAIFKDARRYFLRETWRSQDGPADPYRERKAPIIDPDLLGPDDFRAPYEKDDATDPSRAFDLWAARRDWADRLLQHLRDVPPRQTAGVSGRDFTAIVNAIDDVAYEGRAPQWPPNALPDIQTKLSELTPENTAGTTDDLYTTYGVSLGAARRLIELWEKDTAFWAAPTRAPRLDSSEWGDVSAILLRVAKNSLGDFWVNEENESAELRAQANELRSVWTDAQDASQILFGGREFWKPVRTPAEGDWPPVRTAGVPLIDPELVKREELPEPTAGRRRPERKDVHTLWDERAKELADKRAALKGVLNASGFNVMVADALGTVPTTAATWTDYLHTLDQDLSGTDAALAASAKQVVEQTLRLTVEGFGRLVSVMDSQAGAGGQPLPSKADWAEVFSLLAGAWKLRTQYQGWADVEVDSNTGFEPWRARRHALAEWRATTEERQEWQRAFAARIRAPYIDPDLLTSVSYLKTPGTGSAWTLWDQRQKAIAAKFQSLRGAGRTLARFDQMTDAELGPNVLTELAEAKKAGRAIGARLQQVSLSFEALNELSRVRDLLSQTTPQPVLDAEWDAVCSVLTQVWKERQFADWNLEEKSLDLFLDPDVFQIPPVDYTTIPPPSPPQLNAWRASRETLSHWQDRLQSRIDQDREVGEIVDRVVSEAEEQTLPALRDALIVAATPQAWSVAEAKKLLGDRLAIATEYGGCHRTTRISQAIETFQGILWGVRTGTLADDYPNLRLVGEDFDEEWKWIGSYATWRAAMFVLLYPENILLPSLRRAQTPAFRELVDDLRGARQLTPERARQAAEEYAKYFRDVCTLELKATCRTVTKTPTGDREMFYLFAVGGESRAVYWCVYDPAEQTGYPLSFWTKVEGLAGKTATVIGADSYRIFTKRYLYLFLIVESEGNRELAFARYDLGGRTWSAELTPLKPPGDAGTFDATLIERLVEQDPPTLAIKAANGIFYQRSLNQTGLDWAEGEWAPRDRVWQPWRAETQVYTVSSGTLAPAPPLAPGSRFFASHANDPNVIYLAIPGTDGQVYGFRLNGYILTPRLESFNVPKFVGTSGGAGGITGIARSNAVLPNSQTVMPQIDLFAVLSDESVQTAHWDLLNGFASNQWTRLGNSTDRALADSSVAVTARYPNILDVFIVGTDINVYQHSWGRDTQYQPRGFFSRWNQSLIPAQFLSIPGVTAFAPSARRVDLILNLQLTGPALLMAQVDFEALVHYRWTEANNWGYATPEKVPDSKDVAPNALPAAAVRTNNLFDIFVPRTTGGIWTARCALDAGWSKWEQIGERSATFTDAPLITALTRSANWVIIFAVDERGVIQSSWQQDGFNDDEWHPWAPVNFPPSARFSPGGYVAPVMTVSPTGRRTLHLFTVDLDGVLKWAESSEELPARTVQAPTFSWKPNLPSGAAPSDLVITEKLTERQHLDRPGQVSAWYAQNLYTAKSVTTYLEEMFYFVPLHIALQLQKSGAYLAALDWFRLVYDYNAQPAFRQLVGLSPESSTATDGFTRNAQNWLLDPLNPHSIAATRRNTYPRYTLMAIIRCLLEYADSEFTRDTAETIPRARELYEKALELLAFGDLKQGRSACEEVIGQLEITLKSSEWQAVGGEILKTVSKVSSLPALQSVVREINAAFAGDESDEEKFLAVRPILAEVAEANARPVTYAERLTEAAGVGTRLESAILSRPEVADGLATAFGAGGGYALSRVTPGENGAINHVIPADGVWVPSTVSFDFCVPANPTLKALRLRAEFNLYKINNCRNIAGMRRQIEFYAAPTDTLSGMPVIGGGGQLILPGATQPTATAYRYAVLIERARQLVQQAVQIEAAFLAALEKSDKEAYDLLTARSNVRLAQAGVRVQDLRMLEAQDGVKAAELQRDRAQLQSETYDKWLNERAAEEELMTLYDWLAVTQVIATVAEGGAQALTAAASLAVYTVGAAAAIAAYNAANISRVIAQSAGIILQNQISRLTTQISIERRRQELTFNKALADQDVFIGEQQITLANDRVRITEQERVIEQLKADQAKEVLDFLSNKFTNKELYDWMSDVLQDVYSVLLQQATSVAKLAAAQLAFERQEPPPPYIQDDYWEAPADATASVGSGNGQTPDRRGLTGSARLLQDIAQLDQYAFEKNQRKQPLSKTISLAQHDPLAFQRFIQTGVLPFATSMELFDRDFPGHYLRLIKRVRTSVIALIPPTAGIRATLTASGLSRVVVGGDLFQTVVVRRAPESVALSAPANLAGVSELQEQPEMLLPFEGQGVATSWEFSLPKAANQFDFSTIADVQVVIDYSALSSFDYQQQVVQMLNAKRAVSAERAFSFRYQFADAWYDLHNPDLTSSPMSVGFETVREDFPPNVENVRIEQVTLYFSRKAGRNIEFENVDLRLTPAGGGVMGGIGRTNNGLISTRSGNGGGWIGLRDAGPFGRWQLTLPDTEQVRQWLKDGDVTDILLIVTYAGRLPEWPV